MNTLHSQSLDTAAESPMHALIRTVLQTLHLMPRSQSGSAAAAEASPAGFPYEKSFVTEAEARVFADALVSQGYRVEVQQDIYDYCWSVEVFAGQPQRED
ncbi:hypothetical protein E7V67_011305 [[Empedobacter] haloabium]|uniref:Uncharacterized protein n=1 Tax=[Empedobacter] haloabium TaxID=592317 RepID=A0ABZ1USF4_9BURK